MSWPHSLYTAGCQEVRTEIQSGCRERDRSVGGTIQAANYNDHCQYRRGGGGMNWADVSLCRGWDHKKSEGLSVESKAYRPHTHTHTHIHTPVLAIEPTIRSMG